MPLLPETGSANKHEAATTQRIPKDWWLQPSLSVTSAYINGVYCFAYRIGWTTEDPWTVRINDFKGDRPNAIRKAQAVMRFAAPSLFDCFGIWPRSTVVIPALGSKEKKTNPQSRNSRLAKAIAEGVGASFDWRCLSKDSHPSLHSQLGAVARDEALEKANYSAIRLDCESVLIVDDIVTRGATLAKIAEAVHKTSPQVSIFGFAFGRHQRSDWLPESISAANAAIPPVLAEIWDRA